MLSFTGPEGDVKAAMDFVKDSFLTVSSWTCICEKSYWTSQVNKEQRQRGQIEKDKKRVTPFDTVAVDPKNIEFVFRSVKNVIFEGKLENVEI